MEENVKREIFARLLKAAEILIQSPPKITPLDDHPFGLPHMTIAEPGTGVVQKTCYIGDQGITDVEMGLKAVVSIITLFGGATNNLRLRVIFAEADEADPSHHNVYYELATDLQTIIIGGCTDCGGTGNRGKREMDALFSILKDVYQTDVKEITIPYQEALPVWYGLDEKINAYRKRARV